MLTHFNQNRKRLFSLSLLAASTLVLSACGFQWPKWATIDKDPFDAFIAKDVTGAPPPPVAIPPEEPDQTDPAFAFTPTSTMGVNLETYFIQDIEDPVTRLQRLENVVLAMHKDMKKFSNIHPPQRQTVQGTNTPAAPASPFSATQTPSPNSAPTSIMPAPQPPGRYAAPQSLDTQQPATVVAKVTPPAAAPGPKVFKNNNGVGITGLRVGRHPGKMRIVLDVSGKADFSAYLDNEERLLIIEVPNAQWRPSQRTHIFGNIPVLKSYHTEPANGGNGTMVVLQLKQGTSIMMQDKYNALTGNGERLVVDLRS